MMTAPAFRFQAATTAGVELTPATATGSTLYLFACDGTGVAGSVVTVQKVGGGVDSEVFQWAGDVAHPAARLDLFTGPGGLELVVTSAGAAPRVVVGFG